MKTQCLECAASYRGRSDKKFCSADCRSTYHNKLNRDRNNTMRRTHNKLRKNWRILKNCMHQYGKQFSLCTLKASGFDPNLCTSLQYDKHGNLRFHCYDITYCLSPENQLIILSHTESEQQSIAHSF